MADEIGYFLLGCLIFGIVYILILRPLFALGDIPKELEGIRDELRKIREGKK